MSPAGFPTTAATSATPVRLAVVSGGLGDPSLTARLASRLGDAARADLERRGIEVLTTEVTLRPLATDVAQAHVGTTRTPRLEAALEAVLEADAVVVAAPTYKASMAGMAHAFWELLDDGVLAGVPVLLGATGGTARHSMVIDTALRPLFAQLCALTLPRGVFAATDDWGGGPAAADGTEALDRRIDTAGRSLAEAVQRGRGVAGGATHRAVDSAAGGTAGSAAGSTPGRGDDGRPSADPTGDGSAPSLAVTPFAAILGRH